MKTITVKLTEDQLRYILNQLVAYEDEPMSSQGNMFVMRIDVKLRQALAKAKS